MSAEVQTVPAVEIRSIRESRNINVPIDVIFKQAEELGMAFDLKTKISDVVDFLREQVGGLSRTYRDTAEVESLGRHGQRVDYGEFWTQGDIVDWGRQEKGWFNHSDFVDFDEEGAYTVALYDYAPGWYEDEPEEQPDFETGFEIEN